jgi:hypothetical protein
VIESGVDVGDSVIGGIFGSGSSMHDLGEVDNSIDVLKLDCNRCNDAWLCF